MKKNPSARSDDSAYRRRQTVWPESSVQDFDWLITPNERVGIVGANGTGKTTLLKILAGIDGLDYGSITAHEGHHRRLSAAGRPLALRPHRLRRVHDRLRRAARHGEGAGRR